MPTPRFETRDEYFQRMADDGMGGLADEATISDNIASSFADLGTIYTDTGDIPSTASVRAAGTFTDSFAARQWLEAGGLVASDNSGNLQPIGFVYFFEYFDDLLEVDAWEVWIDEDTS